VRDEYSRYVLGWVRMEDARSESVWERMEELFERHGLPGAIRSDNGSPFASSRSVLGLSRLSVRWVVLGIDLERGRPGCLQDNGGHERMHLDLMKQLQRAKTASSQAELEVWRQEFNGERPHEALGMRCPGEVYQNSPRRYEGLPRSLEYAGMETRRIMASGRLVWQGQTLFISSALQGWDVGLQPCGPDRWEVYFAQLRLGEIEISTASFIPAPWRGNEAPVEPPKGLP
jgi:putative transposase